METLIKTNSKQYRERIYAAILESINFEDNNGKYIEELTPRQKIDYFFATFDSEYNNEYNKKRYPNEQERIAQWLSGLPSHIHIPYCSDDILEFAANMHGISKVPENKREIIISGFFNHMAFMLLQMKSKIK